GRIHKTPSWPSVLRVQAATRTIRGVSMDRRQLMMMGAGMAALSALPGCATYAAGAGAASLEADAAAARAVLPQQSPRAELLQEWTGPYGGVPPWDKVTAPKLRAAILEGIELQRAEFAAIAGNRDAPTFANTLVAMEMAGEPLGR